MEKIKVSSQLLQNIAFAALIAIALVGGFYGGSWLKPSPARDVTVEKGTRYQVALHGNEFSKGNENASVTIVQFSEFECPYCARSAEVLDNILAQYQDDIRFVFKHYPLAFHQNAMPAAEIAYAAQMQHKFWPVHQWLYQNKGDLTQLPQLVDNHQLNQVQLHSDRVLAGAIIQQDMADGNKLGVQGTPSFFVNGHFYSGYLSEDNWHEILQYELAVAKELKSKGINKVYAHLMKDAEQTRKAKIDGPDPEKVYAVDTGMKRPQLGPDNAPVTIIQFADFHCPFCAQVANTIHQVKQHFGEQVRIIYRQRPLKIHEYALDAAKAALAAHKQGQFWPMHDLIYRQQSKSNSEFVALARQLNLDIEQFERDMDSDEIVQLIEQDIAVAQKFGAKGTPSFFINGRFASGNIPFNVFKQRIQQELDNVEMLKSQGKLADNVYASIVASGQARL